MSNKIWNDIITVDLTGVISIVLEYLLSQIFFPFLWTRTLVFVLLGLWSRFSSYSYAWPAVLSAACRPWALARFHQNFMAPEGRQTPLSSDGILSNPPVGLLLCFRSLLTFILCCTYITLRHNYTDHCTERTRRKVGLVKHLIPLAPLHVKARCVQTWSVIMVASFRHIYAWYLTCI